MICRSVAQGIVALTRGESAVETMVELGVLALKYFELPEDVVGAAAKLVLRCIKKDKDLIFDSVCDLAVAIAVWFGAPREKATALIPIVKAAFEKNSNKLKHEIFEFVKVLAQDLGVNNDLMHSVEPLALAALDKTLDKKLFMQHSPVILEETIVLVVNDRLVASAVTQLYQAVTSDGNKLDTFNIILDFVCSCAKAIFSQHCDVIDSIHAASLIVVRGNSSKQQMGDAWKDVINVISRKADLEADLVETLLQNAHDAFK